MKTKLSLLFKILIVVMSAVGLYLNFSELTFKNSIIYFTLQSNVIVFLFYFICLILYFTKKLKKGNNYYIFKGMVTMAITITMVVYQLVLSNGNTVYENHVLANNFVHLFVPLLVICDYIFFGEKGHLKKSYPFIWSIVLIAYMLFDIIYVSLGGTFLNGEKYPYAYMNVDKYGMLGVIGNCAIIYVAFVLYGFIIQTLDNKIGNKKNIK